MDLGGLLRSIPSESVLPRGEIHCGNQNKRYNNIRYTHHINIMDIMNTDNFYSADEALVPEVVVIVDPKSIITSGAKTKPSKVKKSKKK